jgi:hypothetical protein
MDHQPGADRQNRGLQHHAKNPRERAESSGQVAGPSLRPPVISVCLAPAGSKICAHAHRPEHFGVTHACLRQAVSPVGRTGHLQSRTAHHPFGQQCDGQQQDSPEQRGKAQPWMKGKADRDVERHPGQIEKRRRSAACEEAADLVEVAQGLQAFAR